MFTSDLTIDDFALCDQLELTPLAQVMGSSIYQVGFQQAVWPTMVGGALLTEFDTLSEAWNEVRGNALGRLAREAERAGADAVIGVDLRTGAHDFAEGAIEYVVMGTAVRRAEARHRGNPVLTELSVADYSKLVRSGFEPLGIVAWSAVFFASYTYGNMTGVSTLGGAMMQNFELGEFTQAFYSGREQVMARMGAQAEQLGASGIVGVRIAHSAQPHTGAGSAYGGGQRSGLMLTFHAIGTAIREREDAPLYPPEPVIDLTT